MTLALLFGVPFLLGAAAAAAFGIRPRDDALLWAAWCWALGAPATAVLVLLPWCLGLGPRPGVGPGWTAGAALALAAVLAWKARGRGGGASPPGPWARASRLERGLFRLVLALCATVVLDRMLVAASQALSLGDEAHIWAGKAKAMYFAGGPGEGLSGLVRRGFVVHADYPLLNPLLHLWAFAVSGRVVHVENRLCIQLFTLAALLALAAGLRRRVRPAVAAGLLLLVVSTAPFGQVLAGYGGGGSADGMVVAGATLALDAWLRHRDGEGERWLLLWGLGLALCAWSKNDGQLIAVAFAAAAALSPVPKRRLALALLPCAAAALLTWGFNAAHGFENDLLHKGGMPFWERAVRLFGERAGAVAGYFARTVFLRSENSRLLWIAAVLLCAASPRRILGERLRTPALFLALVLAGYAVVFIGTPLPLDSHLLSAGARVCFHVLPAAALWLAAAAAALFPAGLGLGAGDGAGLGYNAPPFPAGSKAEAWQSTNETG